MNSPVTNEQHKLALPSSSSSLTILGETTQGSLLSVDLLTQQTGMTVNPTLSKEKTKGTGEHVVTAAYKPTSITHSCFGNFTSPQDRNLIITKCTRIEIHLLTASGIKPMLDVPIYGRIVMLELFRPRDEPQDILFITTESYKYFILQWVGEAGLIIRSRGDISDPVGSLIVNRQIGIRDPDCRLVGLHLYDGLFKVIPFDNRGQPKEMFNIRLDDLQVLDIKFLYGCSKPTIVVLYQDNNNAQHLKTYEFALNDEDSVEGPWSKNNLDNGAGLLIPVPLPLGGIIVVGENTIMYCSATASKTISIRLSITSAYGMVDGSRFLLSDNEGLLHLLVIEHGKKRVTGLKTKHLGVTFTASTISYLYDALVYVGSSYGDSQLLTVNMQPDAKGSLVQVLHRYVNLGPIAGFCVLDLERQVQGQGQTVTFSGAYKDGALHIVQEGREFTQLASVEHNGITGLWSLRSSTDRLDETLLVVSSVGKTRILRTNRRGWIDAKIKGFDVKKETLFCRNMCNDQLVQVTHNAVRLISSTSGKVHSYWTPPSHYWITVATANDRQVLLATQDMCLFYLEIFANKLSFQTCVEVEYKISCLDINLVYGNSRYSFLAAVGMQTDLRVRIYDLPSLGVFSDQCLEGKTILHSVLLCNLEGVNYLLCGLGDGHLVNFHLDLLTNKLSDMKKVSLGTQPIALCAFSLKDTTHVFATSDRPTVIYSSNMKLFYVDVNLEEVSHMCPFKSAAFPDSVAIAKTGEISIGIIANIQKRHIHSIPFGEHNRYLCHQRQSRVAICNMKKYRMSSAVMEMHFIRLVDQTYELISTCALDEYEFGCSITNCSFTDDNNAYYCVGTTYSRPGEKQNTKGRILVFIADGGKLHLIAEKSTTGAVYSLKAFTGKLLAAIKQKIQLFQWILREDGLHELISEYGDDLHILALDVQARSDCCISVIGPMRRAFLLLLKHKEGAIKGEVRDNIDHGPDNNVNLIGSLVMSIPDSEVGSIRRFILGTVNGMNGIVSSLSHKEYMNLEKTWCLLPFSRRRRPGEAPYERDHLLPFSQ